MNWLNLSKKLYPADHLDRLSAFDRLRFVTLMSTCWFSLLIVLTSVTINVFNHKVDRVPGNLTYLVAIVPTLWFIYRYTIQLAFWYFVGAIYIFTNVIFYLRLLAHVDVHLELNFIMIGIFCIIFIESRITLVAVIFLAINYLAARLLIFHYLHLPFEIGQLISGGSIFCIVFYVGDLFRESAVNIHNVIQRQNSELQQANEKLNELNRVKDKLFGIIGHDLRSPIASLKTQLIGVQEGYLSPADFRQRTNQLAQLVDSVYVTLDNLLHWSMFQRSNLRAHPVETDLSEQAEMVVRLFMGDRQMKQLTLTTHYEPALVIVDEHQIQIVIRNLLHNAIKFTPVGGRIGITTGLIDGYMGLTIQDSGVGIAFERLNQLTNQIGSTPGTAGEKGTGLGLAICREFVTLNKGLLTIQSTQGEGTSVTICFPPANAGKSAPKVKNKIPAQVKEV
ncbi:sensor histidine kinase [Spirosoma pulveris]